MNKAVFIDKDGTLIKNVPYNVNPLMIKLEPHVAETLSYLHLKNYKLIVISNQSGVAKGLFGYDELEHVNHTIQQLLKTANVMIDAFYYCPHSPDGIIAAYMVDCDCKKPKPGLLKQAAQDYNIDLQASWMIGDILNDVEAGRKAGCKTILVNNGNETEWILNNVRTPHHIIKTMKDVCSVIY